MIFGLASVLGFCGLGDNNSRFERDTFFFDHTGDSFDSGQDFFTGSVSAQSATFNCDEVDWWFDVMIEGWMGEVFLHIADTETGERQELEHRFPDTQPFSSSDYYEDTRGFYDPNGFWDNPYIQLEILPSEADVVLGESTAFSCDQADSLSFKADIFDTSGAWVECVTWGRPDADFSAGCRAL